MEIARPSPAAILRGLIATLALLFLSACGGYVELMATMPESEANEVLAALLDAGIRAEKSPGKEGNVSLKVDRSQVARAVDTLRARGLPRERFVRMGEVFKTQTPFYRLKNVAAKEAPGWKIWDQEVIYGYWLEGIGSRNKTTRFKGYKTYRFMVQKIDDRAGVIAEGVVVKYLGAMG